MGKLRQKESSEVEYLRGLVKKLKSQNRNLRKRLKELERKEHWFEIVREEEPIEIEENVDKCPECVKGKLSHIDLHHLTLIKCDKCEFKQKLKSNRSNGRKKTTKTKNSKSSGTSKVKRSKSVLARKKASTKRRKSKS